MSKNESVDRTRGPQITLTTSIGKDDEALVLGLVATSSDDTTADNTTDPAVPTLLGADVLDDASAAAVTAALSAVGATGSHGEVTRLAAPESLGVRVVVAVGVGDEKSLDDPEKLRQAAGVAIRSLEGFDVVATTLGSTDIGAAVEGLFLGAYRFEEFRS
ncbi:MAG: leucyl aminopeptidase, partial [Gordonia polyisoprenivorans]|nr:leucyl aminopeptidase [Gordonia polyisoprenivorans]